MAIQSIKKMGYETNALKNGVLYSATSRKTRCHFSDVASEGQKSDTELDSDNVSEDESNSSDNRIEDIIDEDIDEEPVQDHGSPVVVSCDSDIEIGILRSVPSASKSNGRTTASTKVDCFIAESDFDPQVMVTLELPSKKELRTRLSSRLATLLKRLQSEEVIWRHRHSIRLDPTSERESQTFTSRSIILSSASFIPSEDVVIVTTQNDVLVLPITSFSSPQWKFLQAADALKCSLLITLTQPWREMPLHGSDSNRIIFSPNKVNIQEIPLCPGAPPIQRIPLLCECARQDPEGSTWSSCPHRFGTVASNETSLEQLYSSKSTQLRILVLNKSLLWFWNRIRVAYLVKLSNGSLSIFLRPFHPLQLDKDVEIKPMANDVAPINPGCVYSVQSMSVKPVGSESGLGQKAQSLWQSLANIHECDERLVDFTSPSVDIDAANDAPIFLLKNSDKLQFTLQMSAFSETATLPPYSFPSGSMIAPKFLSALKNISSLREAIDDIKMPTFFAIYSENEEIHLVISTYDAVTPLALLNASNRLDYGHHQSCRVNLSILGAVVVSRETNEALRDDGSKDGQACRTAAWYGTCGFLLLDAFSRIDLVEIGESSPAQHSDSDLRIYRLPISTDDSKRKILSLVEISGTITGVDSTNSQLWPICPSCLLDDLEQVTSSSEDSSSTTTSILQCSRCHTKCGRPFFAVEVMVELAIATRRGQNYKISMLPPYLARMMKISEAQIYHSTSLNPRRLIGQSVNFLFGLLIKLSSLSRTTSDCIDFVIQLHPNLFA
ncbi:hypothetical protein Aperf_G00000004849 [Anoplocephala perfoliata]